MRAHPDENMYMIRHTVYLKHLMPISLKNTGNVLMQSFFPYAINKSCPEFHREDKLDMQLSVTICHITLNQFGGKLVKSPIVPTERKNKIIHFYQRDVPLEQNSQNGLLIIAPENKG